MSAIGFIGLGNMGGPMARNLLKAGHTLKVFDLADALVDAAVAAGAAKAESVEAAATGVDGVITMLPAGPQVRDVYLGAGKVIESAAKGTLLIDCTTADVETSRAVSAAAQEAGHDMIDGPVSGGVGGAEAATLTIMVGGPDAAFKRAQPILDAMGKNIIHAGGPGNGQAAKMCNNMMLGIQMISVCEGFLLAEKLGLDAQKLFDVASTASGQCWALTSYCPVPGPVPASPANRDYQAGFTTAMMLKDMKLSQAAAQDFGVATPLGAAAAALYGLMSRSGGDPGDFSGIIRLLRGEGKISG
ncbi:MAG: 3-hydroxyisobutyrate dehydrogenase [Alphaproteobacteria bacterium]|nr:3-hydroxyisobutyrate dehydrogenase [Alphaproteobacteria bacterium]